MYTNAGLSWCSSVFFACVKVQPPMYTYVGLSWCNSVFFACAKVQPPCTLMQDCHGVAVYSLPV